ncbi:glycosyltransferase [Candidatus Gottesmanbacteria bacterium]|nr:glycosyltransferase [Candidatus Gottesmanbacteria bacterium]
MENESKPSVNIVLPVYNESAELRGSVTTLVRFLTKNLTDFSWHITIADNASTDDTLKIGRDLSRTYSRVSVEHLSQKGRGRAVKHVWRKGTYDYLAYMDIDLSTDLKHFPPLLHALERGLDMAIGSRNTRGSRVSGRSALRSVTSKGYISLIKLFFWVHFTDAQCGFKAVTRKVVTDLMPHIKDNEWFFDSELLIVGEKSGFRIYEEPVTWIDNPGSTVRVMRTALGDLKGLWRLFVTRPWRKIEYARH